MHRIVPKFVIQGGDFVFGNGTGGESVFGKRTFKDERNGLNLKHDKRGILSMGNSGKVGFIDVLSPFILYLA